MLRVSEKVIFSIIIPCYNQGHFLGDALNSILDQEYENFEVIIINDGSTDNTIEIAIENSKKDARIILINKKNQGLSAARNAGLKNASGDYILFLDADDWLNKGFFETYLNAITLYPDFDLFRCGYSYWSPDRSQKYHTHLPIHDGLIYPNVVTQNIGACHSILIRKSLADQLGDFDTKLKSCEDWDYWIRAGKVGAKIKSIPYDLVGYRYIADSMSKNAKVMYSSLSEVTQRAVRVDRRIVGQTESNKDLNWDITPLIKKHFIKCLGVLLHQGKLDEAVAWFQEECAKWKWEFDKKDFASMNSQLTFKYLLDETSVKGLLHNHLPRFRLFFINLGMNRKDVERTLFLTFKPQIMKNNQNTFGRFLGGIINKINSKKFDL